MTLLEIFEHLQHSELRHLSLGLIDNKERQQEVVSMINLGLTDLHKRFWLSSKELVVKLYPHISTYVLDKRYAIQNINSTYSPKYIIDSPHDVFNNDLLKIELVFNECGECVPINDRTDCKSVYTPQWNSVQVPLPYDDAVILVQYRADHPKIEWSLDLDPEHVQIDVPVGLLEPLCYFVGHRAASALDIDGGQQSMGFYQKYDAACKMAIDLGLQVTTNTTNIKLDRHGWV